MSDYQKDMDELLAAVSEREAVDILFRQLITERDRRREAEAALSQYTGTDIPGSGAASDYFAKYEASDLPPSPDGNGR